MSEFEYNNLLFQISQRLDNINAGKQLLVICRGKLAARPGEESIPTFSLFEELEEKGFLSPDRLTVLKAILKGVEEWGPLEKVEKFSCKRKEYNNLLEQIIRVLDELNDLERLISICRGNITEDRRGNIHDVRTLFKELESNDCLGIDCFEIVKEILTQTEKTDLLKEVEEFEQRQSRENNFERRKAQAAAIASSAIDKLAGVLNIKTVFKVVAGGMTIASSFDLLIRNSSYDQLITAINTCVLPAGANLIQMTEGCVCLKVQVESLSALETLWRLYKDGTLKATLQALLVTEEMIIELASGEHVEAVITINEQEYEKVRNKLADQTQDPLGKEEKRPKYLDQEKYDYIQNYLEQAGEQTKDGDSHSVTTDTSDSGMLGSNSASSEVGAEETSDSTSKLCLKDVGEQVTQDLTCRLKSDKIALDRFYRSFGLNPMKLHTKELLDIKDLFPDTSVKTLKDVFEALKLYDLAELLEKATKPRALRPVISLKEIEQLPSANNRPTKLYTKAEVLIIDCSGSDSRGDSPKHFGSFFKTLSLQSQVNLMEAKVSRKLSEELDKLMEEIEDLREIVWRQKLWKARSQNVPPKVIVGDPRGVIREIPKRRSAPSRYKSLLSQTTQYQESETKEEQVELLEEKEEEIIQKLREIKKKQEELKEENEKFKSAVSTHFNNWIEQADGKGYESTLFVCVLTANRFKRTDVDIEAIQGCLNEKMSLIPHTKLVITSYPPGMNHSKIPHETLQVYLPRRIGLGTMLELLNKRYKSLDLIAVMLELKRTCLQRLVHREDWAYLQREVQVQENLSCLPRLHKMEQI